MDKETLKALFLTGIILTFFVLLFQYDAKERQKANDKRLVESFSRMSDSKEIQDAYNRIENNYLPDAPPPE